MKLGLATGIAGAKVQLPIEIIREAEQLGYSIVWTAEAYGSDAVAPLAWVGALTQKIQLGTGIMQMPARTPANTAMTAMTLDQLSGGRFVLGLGLSGPQVVEGWHGQPYGKPIGKTREYVEIIRSIFKRERPLTHQGAHYQIPYQGDNATGLGKPLKSIVHGRVDLPIYIAAIGPKNVELTAEIADGWLPVFFAPRHYKSAFRESLESGLAKAENSKNLDDLEIVSTVSVALHDDVGEARRQIKPQLALYIGGMGARGRNFYNDLACRYGYEAAAKQIQNLYLDGKRQEAIAAVPDEFVDDVALCGPKERIRDQLAIWRESPVTTLNIGISSPETLRVMAELVL